MVGGIPVSGTTDAKGCLELEVPVNVQDLRVEFQSPAGVVILCVGHLDPADSRSGVRQRLIHLGYPASDDDDGHSARWALALFQHATGLTPTGELDEDTQKALENEYGL